MDDGALWQRHGRAGRWSAAAEPEQGAVGRGWPGVASGCGRTAPWRVERAGTALCGLGGSVEPGRCHPVWCLADGVVGGHEGPRGARLTHGSTSRHRGHGLLSRVGCDRCRRRGLPGHRGARAQPPGRCGQQQERDREHDDATSGVPRARAGGGGRGHHGNVEQPTGGPDPPARAPSGHRLCRGLAETRVGLSRESGPFHRSRDTWRGAAARRDGAASSGPVGQADGEGSELDRAAHDGGPGRLGVAVPVVCVAGGELLGL